MVRGWQGTLDQSKQQSGQQNTQISRSCSVCFPGLYTVNVKFEAIFPILFLSLTSKQDLAMETCE